MSEAFDLMAAKMEQHKRDMLRHLNEQLFTPDATYRYVKLRPLTRREQLQRRWLRVRSYFSTLWLALKGRDLIEDDYE